jgi:hypothetical protein
MTCLGDGVVRTTSRPLYHRERPGTRCTGGWWGFEGVLGQVWTARKISTPSGPSSPWRVSIPTTLSWPPLHNWQHACITHRTWRQCAPPKQWCPPTRMYGVTLDNTTSWRLHGIWWRKDSEENRLLVFDDERMTTMTMMMIVILVIAGSSPCPYTHQTTRRHNSEDSHLHDRLCDNLNLTWRCTTAICF